jgi:hypothetical protein
VSDPHDHEPDAFDDRVAESEVHVEAGNPEIEITIAVPVARRLSQH